MSARAPAGSAMRTIGSIAATWTSDTINGSESRLVMSHAEAELYIHAPMLETSVVIQITVNVVCRNGLHGDCATGIGCTALTLFALLELAPRRQCAQPLSLANS